MMDNQTTQSLLEVFDFRTILPNEAEQAVAIEQICFPPNEACAREDMIERILAAPDLFLVAIDNKTGKIAGFLNGIATNETSFRDEFFTDSSLHRPDGEQVMLLGLDVLPQYRNIGLAHELVFQYIRREKKKGRKNLILTCLEDKVGLYDKMAFRDLGEADSTWGGESWHEMKCELKPASFRQLTPYLWAAEDEIVRVYLAVGTKKALLIDTGIGDLDLQAMVEEVTDLPLMVLNTHSDKDHTCGNLQFDEIYMHEAELERYLEIYPYPAAAKTVKEGDVISLGELDFKVLLTPGHTPGSICLLEENKRILISGDSVQTDPIFLFGPGRDLESFKKSMANLTQVTKLVDQIYPSHGTTPIAADYIDKVAKMAQDLSDGNIEPRVGPPDMPCKIYNQDGCCIFY